MDKAQLLLLERASIDMMSPPHSVSPEQRKRAEAMFMELRKSKLPYNSCKFILENSQSDFVLFQSISTIREAVIREWPILPAEEKVELRGYLMQYLTSHPSLAPYVRSEVLHTVALLVKRSTLEVNCEQLFGSVLDSAAQMLSSAEVRTRHLGCSLLRALVTEYSSTSGSSNIGLPLEFHQQCKNAIEEEQLLRVLMLTVQVLQQFLSMDFASLSEDDHALLSSFLQLVTQLLNWDFKQQHRMFRTSPEAVTVTLRPPKCYAPTFLDISFLYLFFRLLSKVKSSENDFHHVVQCLVQLASLTRPVFSTDKEEEVYLANFVGGVLEYVGSSSELIQEEVYGLSCILRRLTASFSVEQFGTVDSSQLVALIQVVTQLTCLCARKTVEEEENEVAQSYKESLEHYLEVCVSFLSASSSSSLLPSLSSVTQPMMDIFNAYTQSKLSAPRGWRVTPLHDHEILDLEEDDRVVYREELSSIGCIARAIAAHSLPLLSNLLEQCIGECMQLLTLIQQDPMSLSSNQSSLDNIYEDLHWLGLVSGYTLCDIVQGESVQIPADLMQHSISRHQKGQQASGGGESRLDFGQNVAALVLDGGGAGGVDGGVQLSSLDPVAALVLSVCQMCLLEKQFVSRGLLDLMSPQLCETTVWCLGRLTEPYLMFTDESYGQVSLPLVAAFGKDSESGRWLVAFLVEKVVFNLSVWASEESLSVATIQLLRSIVKSQKRAAVCIQCDVMWTLMQSFSSGSGSVSTLPPAVQKGLMESLVMCAFGERKKEFLTQLLQGFQTRFMSLVQSPDFHTHCHHHETKLRLLSVLEPMCGLATCVRLAYIQEFFRFLLPILQTCVSLLELCGGMVDVVGVILELFVLVAENYTAFLDQANTTQLYEVCLNLIQTYAKCNTGKYRKGCLTEEEQCEDLLLFLKLLSHLTTKDYLNFAPDDDSAEEASLCKVEPVDVMVTGVSIVLPLMSEETLKFPKLCQQFFTLLHYLCRDFPEKVFTLPDKMIISFMKLLEIGLTNFTQEICIDSLECVESLAVCSGSTPPPQPHTPSLFTEAFQHFLKVIFEITLSSMFDMDLVAPSAAAIFILICTQQEYYSSLAEALVSSQSCDPNNHNRLVQAFQQLTPPSLSLDFSKPSKQTFRKNFEHFLPSVKGFLFYR